VAWVYSTSLLASALVQSALVAAPPPRRLTASKQGAVGHVPSGACPGAGRYVAKPIVHSAVAVDLGAGSCPEAELHGATLWPPAGGIPTRLTLLMPAFTPWMLTPPSRGGDGLPRVPLPRPSPPASSVSPLAPYILGRGGGRSLAEPAAPGASCYAFIIGWLPLSLPPPGLPRPPPSHWGAIGHLIERSGLSPS